MKALVDGQLIDPFIPQENLHTIADVATDTGIWLQEVGRVLRKERGSSTEFDLMGFDISRQQSLKKRDISRESFIM